MNEQIKRIVLVSLAADFIASILYIFALQLKKFPILICFYIVALLLVGSSFLACFNNYKKQKFNILLYMMIIDIILVILYTLVLF